MQKTVCAALAAVGIAGILIADTREALALSCAEPLSISEQLQHIADGPAANDQQAFLIGYIGDTLYKHFDADAEGVYGQPGKTTLWQWVYVYSDLRGCLAEGEWVILRQETSYWGDVIEFGRGWHLISASTMTYADFPEEPAPEYFRGYRVITTSNLCSPGAAPWQSFDDNDRSLLLHFGSPACFGRDE